MDAFDEIFGDGSKPKLPSKPDFEMTRREASIYEMGLSRGRVQMLLEIVDDDPRIFRKIYEQAVADSEIARNNLNAK